MLRYLLVQLQKFHSHIALKLRPAPAGKHPQPGDHHRVEDLEIQGDGRHVRGDKHRGVRHCHDFHLCILPCHWDRGRAGSYWTSTCEIYYDPNMLTVSFQRWTLSDFEERETHKRRQTLLKLQPSALWGAGSSGAPAHECGFLITKEQFITQEINEKDQGC